MPLYDISNMDTIKWNGTELDALKFNGTVVWENVVPMSKSTSARTTTGGPENNGWMNVPWECGGISCLIDAGALVKPTTLSCGQSSTSSMSIFARKESTDAWTKLGSRDNAYGLDITYTGNEKYRYFYAQNNSHGETRWVEAGQMYRNYIWFTVNYLDRSK